MNATATTTRPAKLAKRAYTPSIQLVDRMAGRYLVSSETYTYVLYEVDAINGRCECTANAQWGKVCKHIRLAREVQATLDSCHEEQPAPVMLPRQRPVYQVCGQCGAGRFGPEQPEGWCCPMEKPVDLAQYRGAEGLLEAFGA